ncbi:MAG: DUF4136 domain-containing protein [Maribacter sp.]
MKILKLVPIIIITSILFMSCGPKVTTTKTASVDLTKYDTFAYLPNGNFDDPNMGYTDETVGETVINEVNAQMKNMGYSINKNAPDLLVLLGTKTNKETETYKEPVYATYPNFYASNYRVSNYYQPYYYNGYSGYNQLIGYDRDYETFQEGTLFLSLVDRKSRNVVWKGTASDFIGGQKDSKAIATFVDDIFENYPTKTQ